MESDGSPSFSTAEPVNMVSAIPRPRGFAYWDYAFAERMLGPQKRTSTNGGELGRPTAVNGRPHKWRLFALQHKTSASPIARFRCPCKLSLEPAAVNDQKVKRPPIVGATLLSW